MVQPHNGIFLRLSRKELRTQDTAWRNPGRHSAQGDELVTEGRIRQDAPSVIRGLEAESRTVGARGWGRGQTMFSGDRVPDLLGESFLKMGAGDGRIKDWGALQ